MERLILRVLAVALIALPIAIIGYLMSPTTSVAIILPVEPWLIIAIVVLVPVLAGIALWRATKRGP